MISYGKFYMDNEKIEKKKFLENKVSTIDCFCAADNVQPVCVTFDSSAVGNTCWWWVPYLLVYASLDNIYILAWDHERRFHSVKNDVLKYPSAKNML